MGKAIRWLKGLFGIKKGKDNVADNSNFSERKEKKSLWSFGKPGKDSGEMREIPAAWLRSLIADSDKEQNKHAIVVATATAAAAEAAVAAAQAAVAVVRLTCNGGGGGGGRERLAAVKIQTYFRGFLARKALRALRGLVKLQALVKGYLVRKRAAATLHSMHALIRAQDMARLLRIHGFLPETRPTKFIERFEDESLKIVEIDTCRPKSMSRIMSSCLFEHDLDQDFDWGFIPEEGKFATAHNTPKLGLSGWVNGPTTPAKSVCGDKYCPNYMANTQSFKAKLRSQSAPKQRPGFGPNKRLSLKEMAASRSSFKSVRMQNRVEEDFEF